MTTKKTPTQIKAVVNTIVNWMNSTLIESGQKGFVIGLSGGVDSALVARLASLTEKPTLLINIPIGKRTNGCERADRFGKYLDTTYSNVTYMSNANIGGAAEALEKMIDTTNLSANMNFDLTRANMQSRLRMTYLYMHANLLNALVVGTGNKVEDFGLYFYTKYGDGGVDLSPIADLYKSEVREMAEYLGVPLEITEATPSDELWDDGRSDESQLGATYDEFETVMKYIYGNGNLDLTNIRNQEVLKLYFKWNTRGNHKGKPIPICEIPTIKDVSSR